jgi:CrcB protein
VTDGPPHERPLPHDPDLEVDESPTGTPIPVHLRPVFLALVAAGGAAGSLARHGADELIGFAGNLPVSTLTVNLVGAFALGVLIEWLAVRGSDVDHRRAERLLLGTGFLGGFTTYSALAVQADDLLRSGQTGLALAYVLATVVFGLLASIAGVVSARIGAR